MDIEQLEKKQHSESKGIKYKVSCQEKINETKNTKSWIDITKLLYSSDKNRILMGELSAIIDNKKEVVIKIGPQDSIHSEYKTSMVLNDIHLPNFIKYYCFFKCKDNLASYSTTSTKQYICDEKASDEQNVIVMPYYKLGSFKTFEWIEQKHLLSPCIKQIIFSYLIAFNSVGFLHNDVHYGNFLLKHTEKKFIKYIFREREYIIETNGIKVIIMDFENSLLTDKQESSYLFMDIKRIFDDMSNVLKLIVKNADIISAKLMQYSTLNGNNSELLLDIIKDVDTLNIIKKCPPPRLVYDPNIF